jgi:Na+-driven multidrug efflux pump
MAEITTCETQPRDLTRGGIHRAIWYLAPAMMLELGILNVAQVLDTYWVGQLGSAALAAVTISTTVRWVLNSLANGLGIGGMALVARRIGARDGEAAGRAAGQTILLGIIASLLVGVLGLVVARPLLVALGAGAGVLPLGLAYLRVALGGISSVLSSMPCCAVRVRHGARCRSCYSRRRPPSCWNRC